VLLCGRPFLAILNCFPTLLLYFPGMIHALFIVNEHKANERARRYGQP
jgi:uncharacterized membrane protein YqaE (UPF0057 family)